MARKLTPEQRQQEVEAVEQALLAGEWLRPCGIAASTGLSTAVVLSVLRAMAVEHQVSRREYTVERLHQGRDRTRKTSRLIVEYKRMPAPVKYPSWLMPKAPKLKGVRRLVVFGESA